MKNKSLWLVEVRAETEKAITVDAKAVRMPKASLDALDKSEAYTKLLQQRPSRTFGDDYFFEGQPFFAAGVSIPPSHILRRHESVLVYEDKKGEISQQVFYGESGDSLLFFDLAASAPLSGGKAPMAGLGEVKPESDVTTAQLVKVDGQREQLFPKSSLWTRFRTLDPAVGISYAPYMPTGKIGSINFGAIGFDAFTSVHIPIEKWFPKFAQNNFRLRAGILGGFHRFSQNLGDVSSGEYSATITLIPLFSDIRLYYDIQKPVGGFILSPYFRYNQGVVFSSVTKTLKDEYLPRLLSGSPTVQESYIGYGTQASLGLEFKHKDLPQLLWFLDAGYLLHFQDPTGTFLTFSGGASYQFGAREAPAKLLPVVYAGGKSVKLQLTGTVKSPDARPISGATITVRAKGSDMPVQQINASDRGAYQLDLNPGLDYIIEGYKEGLIKARVEIPLNTNQTRYKTQDFILAPPVFTLESVSFKIDSDELTTGGDAEKSLLEVINFLQENPEIRVEIGVHSAAPSTGADSSPRFSEKRAESVRKYVISKGISEGRLTAAGYGDSKLAGDGNTAKSHRVEVRVLTE